MSRFLAIDDDRTILATIESAFRSAGHDVVSSADPEDAVARLEAESFDVVILDVVMPGRSGLSILKTLRETARFQRLPVLILSSRTAAEDRVRGLRQGADDYLGKPFDPDELIARAERLAVLKGSAKGLSGTLGDFSAADLLQSLAQTRKTGLLEVAGGIRTASVLFAHGEILDVRVGNLSGEDGLIELLSWDEAFFQFDAEAGPDLNATLPIARIELSSTVLEAALLDDELHRREDLSRERALTMTGRCVPPLSEELAPLPISEICSKIAEHGSLTLEELLAFELWASPRVLLAVAVLIEEGVIGFDGRPVDKETKAVSDSPDVSAFRELVRTLESRRSPSQSPALSLLCQPERWTKVLGIVEAIPSELFRADRDALFRELRSRRRGAVRLSDGRHRLILSLQSVTIENLRRDPPLTTAGVVVWLSDPGWEPLLREFLTKFSGDGVRHSGLLILPDAGTAGVGLAPGWKLASSEPDSFAEICRLLVSGD